MNEKVTKWQQCQPAIDAVDTTALAHAQEVARRTEEMLESRGWCLWRCSALGGEVIVVAIDGDVPGIPQGKVIYTEAELKELFGGGKPVSPATLRLIHEAKKRTAALVVPPGPLSKEVAGQIPNGAGDAGATKITTLEGKTRGGRPTQPCYACGSNDWWQRPDGGWVCAWCHPKPGGN